MIGYLRDVLRVLRAPCREQAALLSKQLDAELRPGFAAGVRLHTLYCSSCRRYRAQIRRLRELAGNLRAGLGEGEPMPADVRERVRRHAANHPK